MRKSYNIIICRVTDSGDKKTDYLQTIYPADFTAHKLNSQIWQATGQAFVETQTKKHVIKVALYEKCAITLRTITMITTGPAGCSGDRANKRGNGYGTEKAAKIRCCGWC